MFKWRSGIRGWRVGEYIRQLSVIVLGIVITFVGSDIISGYAKHKETASVMQLIRAELVDNKQMLNHVKNNIDMQSKISKMLLDNGCSYQGIPVDTLNFYRRSLVYRTAFSYNDNSLEVLKNSSLMQHVSDKVFMLSLIQTYESMRGLAGSIDMFYDNKSKALDVMVSGLTDEDNRVILNDVTEFYRIYLASQTIRTYLTSTQGFFSDDAFDRVDSMLDESIQAIDERYN